MTKGILFVATVLLTPACGGSDNGTPGKDFSCTQSQRVHGMYLVHWEEKTGTCGKVADEIVDLSDPNASSDPNISCGPVKPPVISNNDCTIETSVECQDSNGMHSTFAQSIITAQDPDGNVIRGTATVTKRDTIGELCSGSYELTYTKQ